MIAIYSNCLLQENCNEKTCVNCKLAADFIKKIDIKQKARKYNAHKEAMNNMTYIFLLCCFLSAIVCLTIATK